MIREQKNKFWLTLILILSLSFSAFAFCVANVFNNRKSEEIIPVDAATSETLLTDKVDGKWKKNGSTNINATSGVLNIGVLYGGTTISVESADDLNSNDAWYSKFKIKIVNTSKGVNDTYQPHIQNGYELVGFYFYAGSTQYGDLFEAGESATTEQIDSTYTGKITVKAVCKPINYNLYMHYSIDGARWYEQKASFDVEDITTITNASVVAGGNVEEFKAWAIKPNLVTPDNTNKTLKVNGTGIELSYVKHGSTDPTIEPIYDINGTTVLYYKVNRVTGYSNTIENFDCEDITSINPTVPVGGTFDPTIRATWSYIYNGLIDNSSYSNSVDDTKVGAFGDSIVADSENKKANLSFSANSDNNNYGFFKNTGYAFETNISDSKYNSICGASGKYGVYNYGHELTDWTISFGYGENTVYGPSYSGKWRFSTNPKTEIGKLDGVKFYSLAESLDTLFISGYDNRVINFVPSWQAVNIQVHVPDEEGMLNDSQPNPSTQIASTTYNEDYTISDTQVYCNPGQMIYYYKNSSSIIAKNHNANSMPWNYVNIAQSQFNKNGDSYKFADGTYKLTVEPEFVDNVYKISLNNGNVSSLGANGAYKLKATQADITVSDQYKFAKASSFAWDTNNNNIVDITEANVGFGHYTNGSIETYISSKVSPAYTEYNNALANGTLNILRKVFTTNEGATANDLTCTLPTNGTTGFYIYLANNKPAGDLPVFEYGYYNLIAWNNINGYDARGNNVDYSYITKEYKEELHAAELSENIIKSLLSENWTLLEMNSSMVLNAHFFRKNYLLDLNTLRDGTTTEGRYGYILIEITEEDQTIKGTADDKGGKFIAVYDKITNKMQYFDVSNGFENINSIAGLEAFTPYAVTLDGRSVTKDLIYYDEDDSEYFIRLYAGCTLSITASCVDYFNGDELTYVDMVGYYLSSVNTISTLPSGSAGNSWFNNIAYNDGIIDKTSGKGNVSLTSENIESKGCLSGSKIAINAFFAPIDYKITITLKTYGTENPFAGRVDCDNETTLLQKDGETITFDASDDRKINVENWSYLVKYLANAGYTLSPGAVITRDKGNVIRYLLVYNDVFDTSETNPQDYLFTLDGKWLIKNYYTDKYDATPSFAQTLALDVNTELYEFVYNIQIFDESDMNNPISDYNNGTIILDGSKTASNNALITLLNSKHNPLNNGKVYTKLSKELIGNEFELFGTEEGQDFYVIKINGVNYVVLESWLPYTILGNNNYKTIYEFLLKSDHLTSGTDNDIITQSVMNQIFRFGTIVNEEDRTLTVKIKVSELYTITLKAEEYKNPSLGENLDPGYGERTTIIQNHDIGFGNYTNSGELKTSGREFWNDTDGKDYYAIIYTYKGVENVLSSTFNEIAYQVASYRLEGSASNIEGNVFTLDETKVDPNTGNIDVWVTYEPKPITTFNVTYQLNGTENSSIVAKFGSANTDGKLIKELTRTTGISLYFGQSVNYGYELLNTQGYAVSITLNGSSVDGNPVVCQVADSVYQSGGFFLIVNVISIRREDVTIKYVLNNTAEAFADDIYGEMEFLVAESPASDVRFDEGTGTYIVKVAAEKKLEVDISKMAKGYSFVSLKRASTVLTTTLPESKKLVMTESFNFGQDKTYTIVIKKDTIRATLALDNDIIYKDNYNISSGSGNTKSVDAYLGKTLEFTKVDKEKEVLDYYYYLDSEGNEHKIEPDANGKLTLKLTPEVLNQLGDKVDGVYNINFGVKTIKKYKLTYNVVNEIYADVDVKVGENNYLNGAYMLVGTPINVSVVAKDNNPDAETAADVAKYDITLSGCEIENEAGDVITDADNKVEFTEGLAAGKIVLDADKELTIEITPKVYTLENENEVEYIYNSIDSYNSLNPELSTENIGGFNIVGDVKYNKEVTAKFNRNKVNKGELAVVRLSGNDSNDLIVHIKDRQIVSVYDATNNIEYVVNSDNAKHSTEADVTLKEISNLKDKLQEFGYILNFNTTGGDIVEITFIVKNNFEIKTEYLCYKTITPII